MESVGKLVSRSLRLLAVALVALVCLPGVASAGGSWFEPDEDQYEPGDEVTLKGFTNGGAFGWVNDGPFFGFLLETTGDWGPDPDGLRLSLGELTVRDSSADQFREARASITFDLPADLEPGVYYFDYCNASCSQRLGDLLGALIFVGVDPDTTESEDSIANDSVLDDSVLDDSAQTDSGVISVSEEVGVNSTLEEVATAESTDVTDGSGSQQSDASTRRTKWRYGVAIALGIAAAIVAWAVLVASRDGGLEVTD